MNLGFYNIDCMEGMKKYPDKFFDIAIVDPPYFSGPEGRNFYGRAISPIGVQRIYKKCSAWQIPGCEYFDELFKVSVNQIIFGCNYFKYQFGPGQPKNP